MEHRPALFPFLYSVVLLITSSCAPVLYSTISPNTPLPERKHDIEIGYGPIASSSAFDGNLGFSLMGSYAFSKDFFVNANYLVWGGEIQKDTIDDNDWFFNVEGWESGANIIELGLGKYWVNNYDPRWRGEITLGSGYASIKNTREDYAFTNAKYINIFAQPAAGYKSEYFWLITSLKMNWINYQTLDWDLFENEDNQMLSSFYDSNKRRLSLEPGISIGLHLKYVTFSARYVVSTFASKEFGTTNLPLVMNRNFAISIAGNFNFSRK